MFWTSGTIIPRYRANLLESSLWISSAKLGSSPHQKSQSSLRPGVWCLLHTLRTSAARQRLKLHRIGSSSVTGKRMGEEVGPCHTKRLHLIPVKSACRRRRRRRRRRKTNLKINHSSPIICWLHNSCVFFPSPTHETASGWVGAFPTKQKITLNGCEKVEIWDLLTFRESFAILCTCDTTIWPKNITHIGQIAIQYRTKLKVLVEALFDETCTVHDGW